MTDTERLVAFLLDRETERGIAAGEIHNKYSCASIGAVGVACDCGEPERVIAESAARRAIIEDLSSAAEKCPEDDWPDSGDVWEAPLADQARHLLRLLAQPHSAHPGFDPAWRLDQS